VKTIIECPVCGETHIERMFKPLHNSFGPLVITEVCPECAAEQEEEEDEDEQNHSSM